ncbi:hypothetical protein [Methylocystis parvus]|uniref:hypothetical protein n=1 Tax=Methylocystis parvus TaxID=134 RepID=UPI003C7377C1
MSAIVLYSPFVARCGRYTVSFSLTPDGRIAEAWLPRPPVRLTPAELAAYRRARTAFETATTQPGAAT